MAKQGKGVFKRKQAGNFTGSFFDAGANYGRTKGKPYPATEKGRFDAQANKEDYYQWLLGRQGGMAGPNPVYGGASPFGQFLQNEYFDTLQSGYNAARVQSGGRAEFTDYMKSVGWGNRAAPGQLTTPSGAGSVNPFTASSFGAPAAPGAAAAAPPPPTGIDHARRSFLSLTPKQRGSDAPATGYRPGRWSVF